LIIDTQKFRHVSFDLWLTLIRSHPEFKGQRNLLFHRFFETLDLHETAGAIRKFDVLSNENCEKSGIHIAATDIYKLILGELKMDVNLFQQSDFDRFELASEKLFLEYPPVLIFPEINELMDQLNDEGKTSSILSNTAFIKGSSLRQLMQFYNLEHLLAFQIYSDETGFSKPNMKMFEEVFRQKQNLTHDITKEQILHVGDNRIADYEGAMRFGFGAHLLN